MKKVVLSVALAGVLAALGVGCAGGTPAPTDPNRNKTLKTDLPLGTTAK